MPSSVIFRLTKNISFSLTEDTFKQDDTKTLVSTRVASRNKTRARVSGQRWARSAGGKGLRAGLQSRSTSPREERKLCVGISWAVGGLDGLDGIEPYL